MKIYSAASIQSKDNEIICMEDRSRSKSVPGMAVGVRDSFTVNDGKRFTSI